MQLTYDIIRRALLFVFLLYGCTWEKSKKNENVYHEIDISISPTTVLAIQSAFLEKTDVSNF